MASPAGSTETDVGAYAFVTKHLGDSLAACPDAVREALVAKFVADYSDPHTAQLECVLRKRLTDDEVRHLLFAPTPQQYRFYADVLSLSDLSDDRPENATSWQCVVSRRFLTLFCLKHVRNWPLVVEFMLRDGLQILVHLFSHRDIHLRDQAIDAFVQLTSNHVAFEWFEPPVGYEARVLHAKMIALASPDAGFLSRIVANVRLYAQLDEANGVSANRLPSGTCVLLQVLAFFLSWVRKFYTQNELRLSRELLDLLRDWKRMTRSSDDDELRLAQQVFEDFSRWPAIDDDDDEESKHMSLSDHALGPSRDVFSPDKIDALLRLAANDDEHVVEKAIALCSEAIDANLCIVDALLWRARARLTQIQMTKMPCSDDAQLCLRDCASVLDKEPRNMAAWRCQLNLLETMGMWDKGRDLLDAWQDAQTHDGFAPKDAAFLTERRQFFNDKAHEMQQRQVEARRDHATREAKQQQIYRLLLQRTNAAAAPVSSSKEVETATTETMPHTTPALMAAVPSHDILARFRSSAHVSTTEKKQKQKAKSVSPNAPISSAVQTRAFVRQFAQCKRDPLAIRSLLLQSCHGDTVVAAMKTTLPDESLALVLEALVVRPPGSQDEDASLAPVLQHLVSLPRFALMREMASSAQQHQIDDLVGRAHDVLATALGA